MQWTRERLVLPDPRAAARTTDPWLELEGVVERLARLALNGHALADRKAAGPHDPDRLRRLHAGVQLARRAIAAAVTVDVGPEQDPPAPSCAYRLRPSG